MDIEQLKIIVNTLETLSVDARSTFIWWLFLTKFPTFLLNVIWTCIGAITIKAGFNILQNQFASEKLRKAANVSISWSSTELDHAIKTLEKHY